MSPGSEQDRAQQVEVILRQVDSLPTLSVIATRLLQIGNVEDADLDGIVEVIESDPALSAKLLGMCRRADKGLGDRITTVRRAVVMLGLESVQAAALSVAVYELMEQVAPELDADIAGEAGASGVPFDRVGFWKHSLAVACASELIADGHSDLGVAPEEAFVAGLLHDLGKLVLELVLPRSYARVLGLAERRVCSSAEAELTLIGLDHHTVGKRIAEHWGLPAALRDAMWLHGQPTGTLPDGTNRNLVGVVGVARHLCRHLHLGWSGDFNHPEPLDGPRGVCAQFGLSAQLVEATVSRLHENVGHRCRVLGLGDSTTPELLMQAVGQANRRLGRMAAIFEQRARGAAKQAKVLGAIAEFHSAVAAKPGRAVVEVLAEVVRSASGVMGSGFFGVVYQLREGEPWQLCQFSAEGRPVKSDVIEGPPMGVGTDRGGTAIGGTGGTASLASLTNPAQLSMGAMSLLPWLSDYLIEAGDLRDVRLMSLTMGEAAVVLLHDREPVDKAVVGALTATWGAAIAAAAQQEGARRMGERLAAVTRGLAEAQVRLAETESLARLGEMAAGAAHEMNNPLTVICGRAQVLASSGLKDADRASASAIVEASRKLTDLITSLRLLADPPAVYAEEVRVMDLMDVVRAKVAERGGDVGRVTVEETTIVEEPRSVARVDRELLATALAEAVLNGLQASETGVVTVRARSDARGLEVLVRDSGCGMSARALKHAFDPFFSEKPAGRGTGLGLTRARRLIELHGGWISLESGAGAGTTVMVRVPRDGSGSGLGGPNTSERGMKAAA